MKVYWSYSDDPDICEHGQPACDPCVSAKNCMSLVTVFADPKDAKEDQTILGSRWETPHDLDEGYAVILVPVDANVSELLEAEGYSAEERG